MQKTLILIITMAFPIFANAAAISCSALAEDRDGIYEGSAGFVTRYTAICDHHIVHLSGVGLNLEGSIADVSGISVICPFQGAVRGTYFGLSAKAALLVGLQAGAFASRDGVCFLGGGTIAGLGGSANGMKLEIR